MALSRAPATDILIAKTAQVHDFDTGAACAAEHCITDAAQGLIDQAEGAGTLRMAAREVSPAAEDTPKAPLLDLEAVARRLRTLETTPRKSRTLNAIATREPTSFHQATIYYGLNARTRRRDAVRAPGRLYRNRVSAVLRRHWIRPRSYLKYVRRAFRLLTRHLHDA